MSIKLNIESGFETIELDEDRKFKFNANDYSIIIKGTKIAKDIDNKLKEYVDGLKAGLEYLNEDSELCAEKLYEIENETKEYICNKVDELFGNEVSKEIFKGISPLTITNDGSFYVIKLFEAILPIVAERVKEASDKMKTNTEKYTKKYIEEENK